MDYLQNTIRKLFIIPLLCLTIISFGQTSSPKEILQNDFATRLEKSKRLMDSSIHPLKYVRTLEEFVEETFPENSTQDGRWVYYKKRANIQKIEKAQIAKIFPDFSFSACVRVSRMHSS